MMTRPRFLPSLNKLLTCFALATTFTAAVFATGGATAATTSEHSKQMIGYITNWDAWKATNAGFPVKGIANHLNVDMSQYTILNYSFFGVAYDGSLHSGDYRNKNIYQEGERQSPAPLLNTDIYGSWDLPLIWGELEPIYYPSAASEAQGFVVNGQTWTHAPSGLSGNFPIPVRKDGGQPGIIELAHQQGVKVMASIGGWSMCKHFPEMAADPDKRANFIDGVRALMGLGFDGIDLDWEYPGAFAGMNFTGSDADYGNFLTLVKDIRTAIGDDKLITAAFAADTAKLAGFDWNELGKSMDYFNMMTYDFNGGWSDIAGHNAPLYGYPGAEKPDFNWDHTAQWMLDQGIPASKINMGFPFYGRGVITDGVGDVNAPTRKQTVNIQPDGQVSTAADYTHWAKDVYDGTPNYFYIQQNRSGWTEQWDENAKVPYLTKDGYFLSYDNELSIEYKAQYVNDNNLAGGIVWTVMGDFECAGGYTLAGKLPVCAGVNPVLAKVINATFANGCDDCNAGNSSSSSSSSSNHNTLSSPPSVSSLSSSSITTGIEVCANPPEWTASDVYVGGDQVQYNGVKYKARWWTQNQAPSDHSTEWAVWQNLGRCGSNNTPSSNNSSYSSSVPLPSSSSFHSSSSVLQHYSSTGSHCATAPWSGSAVYVKGDLAEMNGLVYEAKWWTQNDNPATHSSTWDVWTLSGPCESTSSYPSSTRPSSSSSNANSVSSSASTPTSAQRRYVTYASTWNTSIYDLTAANIPNYITNVNLAFVRPNTTYVRGSYAFDQAVAGFEFVEGVSGFNGQTTFTAQQSADLIANISALKNRGTQVWLSVGGWSYSQGTQWQSFNASHVVDLALDLGASGIDIDWESSGSQCNKSDAASFSCSGDADIDNIIATLHNDIQGRSEPLGISIAGWSTGAYYIAGTDFEEGKVQWGSPFGGTMVNVVKRHGDKLSFINLMSYDGGSYYDPREGFAAYRAIYNGPINMGMEIAPEGSGGAVLTLNAPAGSDWATGFLTGQNNDASAYYNVETMVDFVKNAGQPSDGFMLWQLWKQRVHQPAPAGAATENSAGQYVCRNLPLKGDCNQAIPSLPKL